VADQTERTSPLITSSLCFFSATFAEPWLLEDPSWKYDIIPEIMDGKNVADFIDPDIAERLDALEREEERLEAEGFYASDDEDIVSCSSAWWPRGLTCSCCFLLLIVPSSTTFHPSQLDSEEEEIRDAAQQIAAKKAKIKKISQDKNTLKNRPIIPRKNQHQSLKDFTTGMRSIGLDPKTIEKRAKKMVEKRRQEYEEAEAKHDAEAAEGGADGMDVDMDGSVDVKGKGKAGAVIDRRLPRTNRQLAGVATQGVSVAVAFFFSHPPYLLPAPRTTAIRESARTADVRIPRTQQVGQGVRVRSSYSNHEAKVDVGWKEKGWKDSAQVEYCAVVSFLRVLFFLPLRVSALVHLPFPGFVRAVLYIIFIYMAWNVE
jgi:hypothetical protein